MKFTNKHNLPEYLYNLLSHEWYGGANAVHDFSVTQMCNPTCMTILQNRHKEELEGDVMDRYFQTIGTGIHHLAEIANKNKKYVVEERKYVTLNDVVISGQVDLYSPFEQKMIDYKVTKAEASKFADKIEKYKKQLNVNKYIFEQNGFPVKTLEIVEIYRDWDKLKALREQGYPQTPIVIIDIPVLSNSLIEYEIKKYISEYLSENKNSDENLSPCSASDRWETKASFAVMKHGGSRALKLCNDIIEAESYRSLNTKVSETYIEERKPTPKRCLDWCEVNKFCPFYNNYMKKQGEENDQSEKPRLQNRDISFDI